MGSTFGFTPAMRTAIAALLAVCLAGLVWRGVTIYQADQRALKAAAFLKELEAGEPSPVSAAGAGEPPAQSEGARPKLVVHVEGAVHSPGVYSLDEGARVNDAILAAGGVLPEGVPGALNLAAPLVDGAKIYVYTREELQPAAAAPPLAQGATYQPVVETPAAASPSGGLISINTASQTELESVPGIGPATARAIIDYRIKNGPFGKVDDLINVSGIGPKTLERLRPYLSV